MPPPTASQRPTWLRLGVLVVACSEWQCDRQPSPPAPAEPAPLQDPATPTTAQVKATTPTELARELKRLRRSPGQWRAPESAEAAEFATWVGQLARAARQGRLPTHAPPAGFDGALTDLGSTWLLKETTPRGAGAVALRPGQRRELIVEAPHTFFDQGTLPLALALLDHLEARALLINTMHRGGNEDGSDDNGEARKARSRSGSAETDVAHAQISFFQTAHEALLEALPQPTVLQLHGFRDEKAKGVQIIVSSAGSPFKVEPLVAALNESFGAGTAKGYPREISVLGGTKNRQAMSSASRGVQFIHLELSSSMRRRLEASPAEQQQFAAALAKSLASSQKSQPNESSP